jgi:hypothetical protein
MAPVLLFRAQIPSNMRWFCTGHFAATWLVCTSLLLHFRNTSDHSVGFVVFGIILWPILLWALPLKGYFWLKSVTLDRLKARVSSGELKKAVVFLFGFCTSLLAAAGIGAATLVLSSADGWFSRQEGALSLAHTLAWFPVAFAVWVAVPTIALALLARGAASSRHG